MLDGFNPASSRSAVFASHRSKFAFVISCPLILFTLCQFERSLLRRVGKAFFTLRITSFLGSLLISKWHGPIEGPIPASMFSGLAPRVFIVLTTSRAIFLTVPGQPECATAII